MRYSSAIIMRSGKRGRPALLATATRCTRSPKRPGQAWPHWRGLCGRTPGPLALRSPARACARPAPPADDAGRSCGRYVSERNHRWLGRQTSRQNSQRTTTIGNQTRSFVCTHHPTGLCSFRLRGSSGATNYSVRKPSLSPKKGSRARRTNARMASSNYRPQTISKN